jgi:hypothetical protein
MAKPKVKKSKSGTQNDSIRAEKAREQIRNGGDPSLITDKTINVRKKKK